MQSLRRLAYAAVLALGLLSCTSKDEASDGAAEAASKEAGGVETIEIAKRAAPKIEVLDAGAEPRMPLRLHPELGSSEVLELSMTMTMSMRNGDQNMPNIPIPITKTKLRADIEGIEGTEIHVRHRVTGVEVLPVPGAAPAVLEKVRETVKPLEQYRALVRMDDRGMVLGGEAEIPRDLPTMVHNTMQQMTESLGQLAVPLPEPALGVGATWRAISDIEQNGMKLRQVANYSLISLEGDRAVVEVSLVQELADPNVEVPGMIGVKTRVSEFLSSGKGVIELELGYITPKSLTMEIELSMVMDVTVLGQNQHVEMDMGMEMTMLRMEK